MMTQVSEHSIPIQQCHIWHKNNGKVILVSDWQLSLDCYELDDSGTIIWEMSDGKHSVKDIAEAIVLRCDEPKPVYDVVLQDVVDFIKELSLADLIAIDSNSDHVEILFVVPPPPSVYSAKAVSVPEFSAPPLGLCYLASVARDAGFSVSIFDMHQKSLLPEDVVKEVRKRKPKIVAFTATTPTYSNCLLAAKFLKAYDPEIVTVVGGPHATCLPHDCLKSKHFDFVCIGEGEITFSELVEAIYYCNKEYSEIKGLAYLDGTGDYKFTGNRPRIPILDEIPFPALDLIDLDSYYQKGSIVKSRGCSFNCNYCACSAIAGRTIRSRTIKNVISEIEYMILHFGIKFFDFHDDTFNMNPVNVVEFCNAINGMDEKISWSCFCRADRFDYDLALNMRQSGCTVVQFGVESGCDSILQSSGKAVTLDQIEMAVAAAVRAGIPEISCGLIIGHPNDTHESVLQTIDFGLRLAELGATRLTLSIMTPYPGTELYDNREKYGIRIVDDNFDRYTFSHPVIETKYLKQDELLRLYSIGICKFLDVTGCHQKNSGKRTETQKSSSKSHSLNIERALPA